VQAAASAVAGAAAHPPSARLPSVTPTRAPTSNFTTAPAAWSIPQVAQQGGVNVAEILVFVILFVVCFVVLLAAHAEVFVVGREFGVTAWRTAKESGAAVRERLTKITPFSSRARAA